MRSHRVVAHPASVRLGGIHPLDFGVGRRWLLKWAQVPEGWSENTRLFAAAYAAGFIAVSLFIA